MSQLLKHLSPSERDAIVYLRSPKAIRDRCQLLFELACQNQLEHFSCDLTLLDRAADYVIQVLQETYPDFNIPFHSRWRHFEVGHSSRLANFNAQLATFEHRERARIKFDLAITSVLLDAGAGDRWCYVEAADQVWRRSEGLAIASFDLFKEGAFSGDPTHPLQANAAGLQQFDIATFEQGFQVRDDNPLIGVEGRVKLMQRLGQVLSQNPDLFGVDNPRPGHLVDFLVNQSSQGKLSALIVLRAVLEGLRDIWSGRSAIGDISLGDVWHHPALPDRGVGSQFVPFHKLSQWLTYSLLEPLTETGLDITDVNALTGLAEYRNGGLCIDLGLLCPQSEAVTRDRHLPGSPVIVEWRALTIVLLDKIADAVRQKLNKSAIDLPLVKILEGGTWTAGRKLAQQLRGGLPPVQIESDGTVF